ncbi:hypothetical protein BDR06DRAFT_1033034 [Suillus hirtellus]|nr:hypothetical protein BDR06DRAFT_1033034 [Suillus hirtellus]
MVFQGATKHLKDTFQQQQGSEKVWSSCQTKWANLKISYYGVLEIKNGSGFLWSDVDGAGISLKYKATWLSFIKPLTALNLSQLTAVANEISSSPSTSLQCHAFQPRMVPVSPAAPSTFLASNTDAMSLALTSISYQDKQKVSTLGSDISVTSSSNQTLVETMSATSANDLACVVVMVSQSTVFSDDNKMDLIDYLGVNEREVVKYLNMDEKLRLVWVQRCLLNIHHASSM